MRAPAFFSSLLLVARLGAADSPTCPEAWFSGRLTDGRAMQLLLQKSASGPEALLQIEGNPYSITLDFRTNTAQGIGFQCEPYGAAERWGVTNLVLVTAGLPARASGRIWTDDGSAALIFNVTNVARLEQFKRQRGTRVAGRGGGKSFSASWPSFSDGVPFHEALSKRFAAEAKGEAGSFTSGAYGIMWEGLKDGGATWNWEGSCKVRLVWLATNLVSVCELRYEYTGGAHGNAAFVGRNFVLENGKARELKLPELFRPGVNWTNALSPLCMRELRRQKADWTLAGASPGTRVTGFTAADLASFNLDGRGLIIHFSDYAVAPHAAGLFSVLIPWPELAPILTPGVSPHY